MPDMLPDAFRVLRVQHRASRYIYVIEAQGLGRVKIGRTDDLQSRYRDLSCASPVALRVMLVLRAGDGVSERGLHRRFAAHRLHGEWFDYARPIQHFVAACLDDATLPASSRNPHGEGPWHPLVAR